MRKILEWIYLSIWKGIRWSGKEKCGRGCINEYFWLLWTFISFIWSFHTSESGLYHTIEEEVTIDVIVGDLNLPSSHIFQSDSLHSETSTFVECNKTQYDWLSESWIHGRWFFRFWNGTHHCKWSPKLSDFRPHKLLQHSKPPKKLFLERNIPRRETLPSTVAIQSQKSWISPVSFLSWNSVLSSSKRLIHTFSLIQSKIAHLKNSSELFKKRQIVIVS